MFLAMVCGVLSCVSAAYADSDVDISVRLGGGSSDYSYSADWYWGDPVLYGNWYCGRSGLGLYYDGGDWNTSYRSRHSPYGTHPNDRGGYRAFIPRGLEGPPELYGDYVVDQYGYPIRPRSVNPGYGHGRHRRYRDNYPLVIPYSYGYAWTPYGYQPAPLYTAPANPYYGYYPARDGLRIEYGSPGYAPQPADAPAYIDNRSYNYYYGDVNNGAAPPPEAAPAPAPSLANPPAADYAPAAETVVRALGTRFYDKLRLDTPDGVLCFNLLGSKLFAAPENGPGVMVSQNADAAFGAFACWLPGLGSCLIFSQLGSLVAAYPTTDGAWWLESLPYNVDLGSAVTIGLVSGEPWVTFNAIDGARYVVAFRDKLWQDIGSGSSE